MIKQLANFGHWNFGHYLVLGIWLFNPRHMRYWLAYCDIVYPNVSIGLSVSLGTSVVFSPFHFVSQHLLPFGLLNDLTRDDRIRQERFSKLNLTFPGNHEDIFHGHLIPRFPFDLFDADDVPFGDPIFFPSCLHHSIHQKASWSD